VIIFCANCHALPGPKVSAAQFLVARNATGKSVLRVWRDSAQELKEHPYFEGIDWQQVYLQKYPPPLIPPRGEVNAADAFDIGSFDEEDTKGIKVCVCHVYVRPRFLLIRASGNRNGGGYNCDRTSIRRPFDYLSKLLKVRVT